MCMCSTDSRTVVFQLHILSKIVLQILCCLKRARLPKVTGLFFQLLIFYGILIKG